VAEARASEETYEVECPHCHRTFEAELITGSAERYTGFKCPHCGLFVPAERAVEPDLEPPA
jgi:DNA-directed RNA polymerase subunit RPC12/RpoP